MKIVLIETSANQKYIFSTNKLRENIGASELTNRIGTKVVLDAVGRNYNYENDKSGEKLKSILNNEKPIEKSSEEDGVEIIIATSGKAILLTKSKKKAEQIIRNVTQTALKEMPGLKVNGAIADVSDDLKTIHSAIGEVHRKLDESRYQVPSNEQRFLRLPFVAPCASSGLPAQKYDSNEKEQIPRFSKVSLKKRAVSDNGKSRLEKTIGTYSENFYFAGDVNSLEKLFDELSWLSIIHADGNGLGQIFLEFDKHTGLREGRISPREHLNIYRKFSIALDLCTLDAVGFALKNLQGWTQNNLKEKKKESIEIPIIPLILGGDDLTVICDGEYALKFTKDFLKKFRENTQAEGIIKEIVGEEGLGICAGIAIVKPHYPFHQAYKLSEQLLKSAKKIKEEGDSKDTALDFHVLYDSAGANLKEIRNKFKDFDVASPYVIDSGFETDWLKNRDFQELEKRVNAIRNKKDGKKTLPNSQLHKIREMLFVGTEETKAFANTIKHRYETFSQLEPLFLEENDTKLTHFLGSITISEFWKGFEDNDGAKNENDE